MTQGRISKRRTIAVLVAGVVALACGLVATATHVLQRLENDTVDMRLAVRGRPATPRGIVVVAIDDNTFNRLGIQWPFPRRLHARVIDTLHADGARAIGYDIQFTEPTDPRDDNALFNAVARAGNVVLATTEVNGAGQTDVLGGPANLRAARAVAAPANLNADPGGIIRRYPYTMLRLPSFAVAVARAAGARVGPGSFPHNSALIDFRGGAGSIRTVSFADVLAGRVSPSVFRGRIVIVGASSPTLQDRHVTSAMSSQTMSGPELQANAVWTALHGNPLRLAPGWLGVLSVVLLALVAPLTARRLRALPSTLVSLALGLCFLAFAQVAFDAGLVVAVTAPLVALALGTAGTLGAGYLAAFAERNVALRELNTSQLELIQRLAAAVESRDHETGEHTYRISVLCRRLALHIGWSPAAAQRLMHASIVHDIGKLGIGDDILLKEGPLDPGERTAMQEHTRIGAELLAGSANPMVQMAETIALTHHERWDGSGYPNGLAGEEIPLVGRICAVVDVYDALLSKRRYKEAWAPADVLAEIKRGSGTQFDPALVSAFLELVPQLSAELHASLARETPEAALRALAV